MARARNVKSSNGNSRYKMIVKEECVGGFTDSAKVYNTYIQYPIGMTRKARMSAFSIPAKIVPGCKIIVPKKIPKPHRLPGEGIDSVKAIMGAMMTVLSLLIIAKQL